MKGNHQVYEISQTIWRKIEEIKSYLKAKNYELCKFNSSLVGEKLEHFLVGQGCQSIVLHGINNQTNKKVAIKIHNLDKDSFSEIEKHRSYLSNIKYPQFNSVAQESFLVEDLNLFIEIMDLFKENLMGSIQSKRVSNQQFSNKEIANIFFSAINGLYEIHTNGFVHLNIKPENILLDTEGIYKLSDSTSQDIIRLSANNCFCFNHNSNLFISPEQRYNPQDHDQILQQKENEEGEKSSSEDFNSDITNSSDIYSLGLVFLQVLGIEINQKILNIIQNGSYQELYNLVIPENQYLLSFVYYSMLPFNPENRYSIIRLRKQFMTQFDYLISKENEVKRISSLLKLFEDNKLHHTKQYAFLYYSYIQCITTPREKEKTVNIFQSMILGDTSTLYEKIVFQSELFRVIKRSYHFITKQNYEDQYAQLMKEVKESNNLTKMEKAYQLWEYAEFFMCIGDSEEALQIHRRALTMREEAYKEGHPDIAQSIADIGDILLKIGQFQQSLDDQLKALKIRQNLYMCDHYDVASSYNRIGITYISRRRSQECLQNWDLALKIRENIYSSYHEDIAFTLDNISKINELTSQNRISLKYALQAFKIREELQQQGKNTDLITNMLQIAKLYTKIMEYRQSIIYYKKIIVLLENKHVMENEETDLETDNIEFQTGEIFYQIGSCYQDLREFQKALFYYQKSEGILRKIPNLSPVRLQKAQNVIKWLKQLF